MKRLLWNLRFRMAWRLMPGQVKHMSAHYLNEHDCMRCF